MDKLQFLRCFLSKPNFSSLESFSRVLGSSGPHAKKCNRSYSSKSSEKPVICKQLVMEEYGEPHKVVKMRTTALPSLQKDQVGS